MYYSLKPPRKFMLFRKYLFSTLFICLSSPVLASKCLFISSYHTGYEWSDGVALGLRNTLRGECEIKQFDMDTKRHKDEISIKQAALTAKALIDEWQPDVVITADDNAAKYVIASYYRDAPIPFVFCGINWSVEEYGLPYSNTTGIVEVAPIGLLLTQASNIVGGADSAVYIGADTLTERKNLHRFTLAAEDHRINLKGYLVSTSSEWIKAYKIGQNHDFLIIGSNSGIKDWDATAVKQYVHTHTRKLSATNHGWMLPYTMLGFTKDPEEQGVWAGKAAIAVLNGAKPNEIPIVSNRKWEIWINEEIVKSSGIEIPDAFVMKAKKESEHR
jgi:ABC-type uncharacterized transport system substrate-binding protein